MWPARSRESSTGGSGQLRRVVPRGIRSDRWERRAVAPFLVAIAVLLVALVAGVLLFTMPDIARYQRIRRM